MSLVLLGILNSQAAGGAAPPAMELITERSLSGSTYTISSIPQTYKHLYLEVAFRTTVASGQAMLIRLNGDSGSNYNFQQILFNQNGTRQLNTYTNQTAFELRSTSGTDANAVTGGRITISDYTSATKRHTLQADAMIWDGDRRMYDIGGFNTQTGALTSITFVPGAYNWTSTYVSLYGVLG